MEFVTFDRCLDQVDGHTHIHTDQAIVADDITREEYTCSCFHFQIKSLLLCTLYSPRRDCVDYTGLLLLGRLCFGSLVITLRLHFSPVSFHLLFVYLHIETMDKRREAKDCVRPGVADSEKERERENRVNYTYQCTRSGDDEEFKKIKYNT